MKFNVNMRRRNMEFIFAEYFLGTKLTQLPRFGK